MTLIEAILKAKRGDGCTSPPPELKDTIRKKKKIFKHQYEHIRASVDTSPPAYDPSRLPRHLPEWKKRILTLYEENVNLLTAIKTTHFRRGKVDCRWKQLPPPSEVYYKNRADFYKRLNRDNQMVYQRILKTRPRVVPTSELRRAWVKNRQKIILIAQTTFVLFPIVPCSTLEDVCFKPPSGVKRPRVILTLQVRGCAVLGVLQAELFTEVCPRTCKLFLELLQGDGLGYSYVGTCFFRKVPGLFWSGGDVVHNNGFGCYAQRGLSAPVGAENYHFPHSMPGLLSMRVTRDDEMCGTFNITFKPMPQFDLNNVVFGRILRPSTTFDAISKIGSALSVSPVVELVAARQKIRGRWVNGTPNTKIPGPIKRRFE